MSLHGSLHGRAAHRRTGRIVVRGEFGPVLATAIPGSECRLVSGDTQVTVPVRDQAELFGVLNRLRDLGAEILSLSMEH